MNKNTSISSLADIILVTTKHLGKILILVLLFILLTIIYINKNYVPEYTSSSKIFIPTENSNASQLHNIVNKFGLGSDVYGDQDISSSMLYPEIVASRTFSEKMLKRVFYSEEYDKELPLIAILTYGVDTPRVNVDTLVMKMSGVISGFVKFENPMPFLLLDVTTEEPQLSKELAEAILEELDQLQRRFKSQATIEKREYINQQIELAKNELERLEEKLKRFRETNRKIESSPSLMLEEARINRDVEIQQGIFLTLKQQLELAKIEEIQKSSFVQILDSPSYPLKVSNPKKISTYILGGIAGLFLALCIVFIVEYFGNTDSEESKKLVTAKEILVNRIKRLKLKKINLE